mmetsp:Transcript_27974/g.61298  ORF Transcript_27974/g.61298 Transcript_27974/m.61298 type:complete len:81 (+) Transcript_27974:525-767(+)
MCVSHPQTVLFFERQRLLTHPSERLILKLRGCEVANYHHLQLIWDFFSSKEYCMFKHQRNGLETKQCILFEPPCDLIVLA